MSNWNTIPVHLNNVSPGFCGCHSIVDVIIVINPSFRKCKIEDRDANIVYRVNIVEGFLLSQSIFRGTIGLSRDPTL